MRLRLLAACPARGPLYRAFIAAPFAMTAAWSCAVPPAPGTVTSPWASPSLSTDVVPGQNRYSSPTPTPGPADLGVVAGTLVAPAGLTAGAASSPAAFGLLAIAEFPLAGATVHLADAALQPVPGIPATTTDGDGAFAFARVPAGYTYHVVATVRTSAGGSGRLVTLARVGGGTAAVSAASTLAAAQVVQATAGLPGAIDPARFLAAVDAIRNAMGAGDVPDFGDRAQVLARAEAVVARDPVLGSRIAQLRTQAAAAPPALDELVRRVPTPGPSAVPSAAASAAAGSTARVAPAGRTPFSMRIGPATGGCEEEAITHGFRYGGDAPAAAYPLTVTVTRQDGTVATTLTYGAPNEIVEASLPEECGHAWVMRDAAGTSLAGPTTYSVIKGVLYEITLPF